MTGSIGVVLLSKAACNWLELVASLSVCQTRRNLSQRGRSQQ